jgi:hypothetical protein
LERPQTRARDATIEAVRLVVGVVFVLVVLLPFAVLLEAVMVKRRHAAPWASFG